MKPNEVANYLETEAQKLEAMAKDFRQKANEIRSVTSDKQQVALPRRVNSGKTDRQDRRLEGWSSHTSIARWCAACVAGASFARCRLENQLVGHFWTVWQFPAVSVVAQFEFIIKTASCGQSQEAQ